MARLLWREAFGESSLEEVLDERALFRPWLELALVRIRLRPFLPPAIVHVASMKIVDLSPAFQKKIEEKS